MSSVGVTNGKSYKNGTILKKGPSPIVKNYLIAYNLIQTIGWTIILYLLTSFYLTSNKNSLYETLKWPLIIFQNAAILEVFHAAFRLVPSSPFITGLQVASRVIVVSGVLMITNAPRETIGLPLSLLAWSITEVIRYANYTLNLVNAVPHFLIWLRYTTFIVLYPCGVIGELLCMYSAVQEIEKTQILTIKMPNPVNFLFNYQYFLWTNMLLYIPFFPQLYMHMFTQRKKVLGGSPTKNQ